LKNVSAFDMVTGPSFAGGEFIGNCGALSYLNSQGQWPVREKQ
jgi:hypothetical protein